MINSTKLRTALAAAAIILFPAYAQAATALAVGVTGKPADGIAFGYSHNYKTTQEAESTALQSCREYKARPRPRSNVG